MNRPEAGYTQIHASLKIPRLSCGRAPNWVNPHFEQKIRQASYVGLKMSITKGTLQGTNISPQNGILKMIFLFPRWDMLIPWRVSFHHRKKPPINTAAASILQLFICQRSPIDACWVQTPRSAQLAGSPGNGWCFRMGSPQNLCYPYQKTSK